MRLPDAYNVWMEFKNSSTDAALAKSDCFDSIVGAGAMICAHLKILS